jgi:tetratricopeptide (TPR) repeat protein
MKSLLITFCLLAFGAVQVSAHDAPKGIDPKDSVEIKRLHHMANELRPSKPDSALKLVKRALAMGQKLKWTKEISHSYNNMGQVYTVLGKYDSAVVCFMRSLEIKHQLKDSLGMANSYLNLGKVYVHLKNYDKAESYVQDALRIFTRLGKEYSVVACYQVLGVSQAFRNNNEKGLEYQLKALAVAEKLKDPMMLISLYGNIGEIYQETGNYQKALLYLGKALPLAEKLNKLLYLSAIEMNLGRTYYRLGDYSRSLAHLEKGCLLATKMGDPQARKEGTFFLSEAYERKGDLNEALRYYKSYIRQKDSLMNEKTLSDIAGWETKYKTEMARQQVELLKKENEIQALTLSRNKTFIFSLGALLLVILILSGLLVRHNRLKSRQKALMMEQKALRAQINPHFLFNALNSIQKFIVINDHRNAHAYIGKFSSLMRSILDNSDKMLISMAEELQALELYLQIEQLRVNGKFDYEINTDPELDSYNTSMPSMILQPYVENAIWHGVMNSESKGFIKIDISKRQQDIVFTILDNGIGRTRSAELRGASRPEHRPSGMRLVQDRIAAINASDKAKINIQISDVAGPDQTIGGTRVEIVMRQNS